MNFRVKTETVKRVHMSSKKENEKTKKERRRS